jgi:hypothetical protein
MARPGRRRPRTRKQQDVALVLDRTDDSEGYQILRRRGDHRPVELGTIRPLKEGRPIDGEVVSLKPRKDVPFLYDVKTELPDPVPDDKRLTSDGPPQVATAEYRRGWEAIWGKRRKGRPDRTDLN